MAVGILAFDLETTPQSHELILLNPPPFEAPSNWVDVDKIDAKVEQKRTEFLAHGAALDALACHVRMAAFRYLGGLPGVDSIEVSDHDPDDAKGDRDLIGHVLHRLTEAIHQEAYITGYHIRSFDLPLLRRRAALLDLPWPRAVGQSVRGRWYWSEHVYDLATDLWGCGSFRDEMVPGGLDRLAKGFGLPGKLGDGAEFGALYAHDPERAREYLSRDIDLVSGIAERVLAEPGP